MNNLISAVQFRETYLNEVIDTIEDEKFVSRSRSEDGGKGFSRKRKISFTHLIVLLRQGLSRSIQRELNSFYQKLQKSDFSIQHVTKGAFSRCRAKLKPEAFVELNQVGIKSFYNNAPWLNFQGLRLLAVDGSTAVLPKHRSIIEEFGTTNFGPYADSPRSVARISVLYDVLNLTVLDAHIDKYDKSEREMARKHLDFVEPGKDLLVFDRGYPSLGLMFEMQAKGINYLIRMREDWWLEVRKMVSGGVKDKEVTFTLPSNEKDLLKKYNTPDKKIKCRLVSVELPEGGTEVLCTSIVSKEILPYECFAELYHYRWNIEEGYKLFKCRLQLEAFSGKTAIAVKQDFFAKIFTMTTTAVLAFPVDEKLKKEVETNSRKHPNKVNRTNALSMFKEIIVKVFIEKIISPAIEAFDKILEATTEIIRPGRKFERKKLKKKPPSMNYKQL
ncbi:MAG: IS4 family transposase [Segetibacter sp.]|nr:IS4 family transposase [Segetibacter sp.]